jgi:toxin ParE1/3/4
MRECGALKICLHESGLSVDYEVVRAENVDDDLELIFEFLLNSAEHFGEDEEAAFSLAEAGLIDIQANLDGLGKVPYQGTLRPDVGDGIRNVTKGRAIFYFEVEEQNEIVRVLAVFYGGQDHDARILFRLLT